MARQRKEKRYGRLSRSGHTSHLPRLDDTATATGHRPTEPVHRTREYPADPYPDSRYHARPPTTAPPPGPSAFSADDATLDFGRVRADEPTREFGRLQGYGPPRTAREAPYPDEPQPRADPPPKNLGRAALSGTNRAARAVTTRVIDASKSKGAHESGLTGLVWNQVLSYGTDAMVTVALAGTVFFGASAHAQRGNVLLYLLVTMAPFAVVAPFIGPALDRLQHGRRWTMAATGLGRAVLALVMATHPTDLLVLYPCALGSLVLSKAYGVVRAAAAPRLVPPTMTLTEANARLTIFGLGSTLVLGGLVGAVIKVTGSYSAGLVLTAIGFGACAFFALKLPAQVDSAAPAPRHPEEPKRPRTQPRVPPLRRLATWAREGFDLMLVLALQGESALRLLSGMLTIYLAFYVESTAHGLTGALELALVVGAAGAGNFLGTAIGTRVPMPRPALLTVVTVVGVGVLCLLVALAFNPFIGAIGFLIGYVGNALCKIALDSLIQRDVVETLRSSAFARSETFLQLAWVLGAVLGVVLPSHEGDGPIGFLVVGGLLLAVGAVIAAQYRNAHRRHVAMTTSPTRRQPMDRAPMDRAPMAGATTPMDLRGVPRTDGSVGHRSVD